MAFLPSGTGPAPARGSRIVGERANVRVVLRDGRVVKGDVVRVSSEELVLGRPGNYGTKEEIFPASAIESIEVESLSQGGQAATVALVALVGVVVIGVASLSASGGFGGS